MTPEEKLKRKEYMTKWRAANKDRIKKYRKEYESTHREEMRERDRAYYNLHKEEFKERRRQFVEENPDYFLKYNRKYYARERKPYSRTPVNIYENGRGKWKVQFGIDNKDIHYGTYETEAAAKQAAQVLRKALKIKSPGRGIKNK